MKIGHAVAPLASALSRSKDGSRVFSEEFTFADWATRTGQALEAASADERGDLGGSGPARRRIRWRPCFAASSKPMAR